MTSDDYEVVAFKVLLPLRLHEGGQEGRRGVLCRSVFQDLPHLGNDRRVQKSCSHGVALFCCCSRFRSCTRSWRGRNEARVCRRERRDSAADILRGM